MIKKRTFKHYKTRKKGGQHYWIGRKARASFFRPKKGKTLYEVSPKETYPFPVLEADKKLLESKGFKITDITLTPHMEKEKIALEYKLPILKEKTETSHKELKQFLKQAKPEDAKEALKKAEEFRTYEKELEKEKAHFSDIKKRIEFAEKHQPKKPILLPSIPDPKIAELLSQMKKTKEEIPKGIIPTKFNINLFKEGYKEAQQMHQRKIWKSPKDMPDIWADEHPYRQGALEYFKKLRRK